MTEKSITLPVLREAAKLARRRCWQAVAEIDGIMGGVKLRLAGMPYSKRQKFLGEVFDQLKPYLAIVSALPAPPTTSNDGAKQEGDA